eukprot:Rmarinus@m.4134
MGFGDIQHGPWVRRFQHGLDALIDGIMKAAGPVFVCTAFILTHGVIGVYFWYIYPRIYRVGGLYAFLNLVIALTVIGNIFFNYIMCLTTPPGRPEIGSADIEAAVDDWGQDDGVAYKDGGRHKSFCKKCQKRRPPRSHHCQVCGTCVLKMDHHCPWVNNCVGWGNYKYFYLFLVWLCAGSAYATLMLGDFLFGWIGGERFHHRYVMMAFIVAVSVTLSLFLMSLWHGFLILRGLTTIEFYHRKLRSVLLRSRGELFSNPYDLGSVRNFEQIFGQGTWGWRWLVRTVVVYRDPLVGVVLIYGMVAGVVFVVVVMVMVAMVVVVMVVGKVVAVHCCLRS